MPSLAIFQVPSQPPQHMDQVKTHAQNSESRSDQPLQQEQQRRANSHKLRCRHQAQVQNDWQHICALQQQDVSSPSNEADSDNGDQHTSAHGMGHTSRSSPEDKPQPSRSGNQSRQSQSALLEVGRAIDLQHGEEKGTEPRLTVAMEQVLASLPDIDVITSPERPHHNREEYHLATCQEQNLQEQLSDQAEQMLTSKEACGLDQDQPESVLHEEAMGQGAARRNQAGHSNASDITHGPASFHHVQPTQKQLRKQKRKGALVPQVDSAVQACRISIGPGLAAVQPCPGSPGPDYAARAIQGLVQAPHRASISRPELAVRAKAHSAKPAQISRPQPVRRAAAPTHRASKLPTQFIAELQLDLAARVLAKQPDLSRGDQLSSVQQRGLSHSHMLLSCRQRRNPSATGASALAAHEAAQQASSAGALLHAAAGQAPKQGSAPHNLTHARPPKHGSLPCAADPHANRHSGSAMSAAGALCTTSTPAFQAVSPQTCVAPGGQSSIMGRAGQPPPNLQALMCAMAASEHTAAALEQQLAASYQRAAGPPGSSAGSMLSLLTAPDDAPVQTVQGIPISLQGNWPECDPTLPSRAQRQLIVKHINDGAIIQGQPIGVSTLHVQQTAQRAAQGARLPLHSCCVTQLLHPQLCCQLCGKRQILCTRSPGRASSHIQSKHLRQHSVSVQARKSHIRNRNS